MSSLTMPRNIQYSTTIPLVSTSTSLHRTFMDTTGRTMLTLNAINIVDDVRDRELIVTYDYPLLAGLRKPLVIFTAFLSLFVAAWAIGSLDVGIKGKKA
jgi:oligosaccharyltransferase complex subunit alpha (ribophorin I)